MPGIDRTDTQGYQKWLHAEELSNQDSLPDVKKKQEKLHLSADLAGAVLDTTHGVAGLVEIAAMHAPGLETAAAVGSVAAPFLVGGAGVLQWAGAHAEGDELNAALMRDANIAATLNLGEAGFGPELADFVAAQRDRLVSEYAKDSSARALMQGTTMRLVDMTARGEGGLAKAQAEVSAGVGDGIRLAQDKGFGSPAEVAAQERANPQFRQRYEADPAFHLGVDAVVWRAQHPAPAVPASHN